MNVSLLYPKKYFVSHHSPVYQMCIKIPPKLCYYLMFD